MATQNVTLYVNGPYAPGDPNFPGRFITSPTSALPPTLPAFVAGDTWVIKLLYYLGDGSPSNPFFNYRFPGSTNKIQLRAAGNSTVYATATASSEIAPPRGVSVSKLYTYWFLGDDGQKFTFGSPPIGGSFQVTFVRPSTISRLVLKPSVIRLAMEGSVTLSFNSSISDMENALESGLTFYAYDNAGAQVGGPFAGFAAFAAAFPNSDPRVQDFNRYRLYPTLSGNAFNIKFGTRIGSNFDISPYVFEGDPSTHDPIEAYPLATADETNVIYSGLFGWNVTLPLDGNGHTFSDLFLGANKPAYLEVLLTQSGLAEQTAARKLLPSTDDPPAILNGPPPSGVTSTPYSFAFNGTGSPTYAVTAGALPEGLSLSSNGVISGSPFYAGTYTGTITATNAYGTATQNFSIVITGNVVTQPPSPLVIFDGDFTAAQPVGEWRISQPDPGLPNGYVARKEYWQLQVNRSALPVGSSISLRGQTWYLVDESEPRDLGAGIVAWDRVYATIPQTRLIRGSGVKNIKYLTKVVSGSSILAAAIWSQTKTINCDIFYDYSRNPNSLVLPEVPDISLATLNGVTYVWATGGFPFTGASPQVDSNEAYCFIGGEKDIYMGDIYVMKKYYGAK